MLLAWRSFHQFATGTNCKAWLFRIMLNLSNQRLRQTQGKPNLVSLDEYESLEPVQTPAEAPSFTRSEILAALESLPPEHRTIMLLVVVEGFTCKETAQMLNVPMGTVMSRLARARLSLRKRLSENPAAMGRSGTRRRTLEGLQ